MPSSVFEWSAGSLRPETPGLPADSRAAAYTTLRTYGGRRVLRLAMHLDRLVGSVAALGRPGSLELGTLRAALGAAVARAGFAESRLRVTFAPPRLLLAIEPFTSLAPELYRDGVACVTSRLRRERPAAKDTRFQAVAERARAELPSGVHEALLVSDDGAILEGLSSNFFAVGDGTLFTEGPRVLPGVTRAIVLELARARLPVREQAVPCSRLALLSEGFLTSVSRGILPVASIDGRRLGDGRPGRVAAVLRDDFEALVAREAEPL